MQLPLQTPSFRSFQFSTIQLPTFGITILLLAMVSLGSGTASAQLVSTPARVGFGAIVLGETGTSLVTVTNNGSTSTTITGVTVGNSAFTMSSLSLPLSLAAGESVGLSVNFTPTARGWTGGSIKFSGDAALPILQLEVAGAGVGSEAVTANPPAVSFGQVPMGSVASVPVVLTNARSWKVTISGLQIAGAGFSTGGLAYPVTLNPGQSVTANVTFTPPSASSTAGTLFVSGPGLAIPLTGTGGAATAPGQLTANPASLAFGSVQVGANVTLTDSFTNTGGSSVTISQAAVTGAGFSISGLTLPMALPPGETVTFSAMYTPQAAASTTGGISVSSNASDSALSVSLSGTGTAAGQLTLAPTAVNFGNTPVGSSVSQTSSLTAGGASVTVSSASLTSAEFSLSGTSFPVTIPAGQSVPVTLTFAPQTSGSASAVLSVSSNAANSAAQTLSGVGTPPVQHTVALSWNDSGSDIAGYNVYRGSVSGGPYTQINSTLESTTAYTDDTVVSGQTYYYVTTAVDASGTESGYSNVAEGVIPTP